MASDSHRDQEGRQEETEEEELSTHKGSGLRAKLFQLVADNKHLTGRVAYLEQQLLQAGGLAPDGDGSSQGPIPAYNCHMCDEFFFPRSRR